MNRRLLIVAFGPDTFARPYSRRDNSISGLPNKSDVRRVCIRRVLGTLMEFLRGRMFRHALRRFAMLSTNGRPITMAISRGRSVSTITLYNNLRFVSLSVLEGIYQSVILTTSGV